MKSKILDYLRKNYAEVIFLVIVLLVASYFRLYHIKDYMVFLGDQGRDVLIVKRMIVDKNFVFIGPTASVGGFFLGPFYYYMMIIPLILSNFDPVGPAFQVGVLSVLSTYLCYYFGKRYGNQETGVIAASIFAVSRLVVEYSRTSWNPNVLPFFSLILLISLAKILEGKTTHKLKWFAIAGAMLGIIIQLHYQAIVMHVLSAICLALYVSKQWFISHNFNFKERFKELGAMILGTVAVLGPFLAFEIKHSFPNTRTIIRFVFGENGSGFEGGQSYEYIVRDTVYRLFLRLVAGGNDTLAKVIIAITALGLLIASYKFLKYFAQFIKNRAKDISFNTDLSIFTVKVLSQPKYIGFIILVLYFICGVGFWGFYKRSIFDYYYSYMYPLPILLFAYTSSLVIPISKINNMTKLAGTVILSVLVCFIININVTSIRAMSVQDQVYRSEEVARSIIKHKAPGPYNFALVTPGNSDHAYRYFLEIWGQKPTPLEESVTTQLLVFCEPAPLPCEPEGNSLWEVAGFGPASIVGQWQTIGLPLYRLEHTEENKHLEGKPAKKG